MTAEGKQTHGSAESTLPAGEEAPASALRSGDVVDGRYRIERRLGRGGFGAVYAAEHLGTGQSVALKVRLVADDPDEAIDIQRFSREARITARLRHPNTVRVFDLGLTRAGSPYIAMELLSGPTLEHVLRERAADGVALSQDETIDVALAVLASLSEAHGLGLVHRDLKPANLMFDTVDGVNLIKLLDFGIARQSGSSLTASGASLGTPAYMSPEQCQALELDGRSDLYSLGVILFRCVTGQLPFADGPPMAMMYCHTSQPPPDLASMARTAVTDGFVACVMRCLAKEPARRFQSAREMHDILTSIGWSESTGTLGALPSAAGMGVGAVAVAQRRSVVEDTRSMVVRSAKLAVRPRAPVAREGATPPAKRTTSRWAFATVALAAVAGWLAAQRHDAGRVDMHHESAAPAVKTAHSANTALLASASWLPPAIDLASEVVAAHHAWLATRRDDQSAPLATDAASSPPPGISAAAVGEPKAIRSTRTGGSRVRRYSLD